MKKFTVMFLAIILIVSSLSFAIVGAVDDTLDDDIALLDDEGLDDEDIYEDDEYFDDEDSEWDPWQDIELTPEEQEIIDGLMERIKAKDYTAFNDAEELDEDLFYAFYLTYEEYFDTLSDEEMEQVSFDIMLAMLFVPPVDADTFNAYISEYFPGYTQNEVDEILENYMLSLTDKQQDEWESRLLTDDDRIDLNAYLELCAEAAESLNSKDTKDTKDNKSADTKDQKTTASKATGKVADSSKSVPNPNTGVEGTTVAFAVAACAAMGLVLSSKKSKTK